MNEDELDQAAKEAAEAIAAKAAEEAARREAFKENMRRQIAEAKRQNHIASSGHDKLVGTGIWIIAGGLTGLFISPILGIIIIAVVFGRLLRFKLSSRR